jgi:hypothetical protein
MRGALILAGLMVTSTMARPAEPDPEPLNAAFLEYLANMEGDDDDWTLLADTAGKSATPADSKSSSEASPAPQPSKEAAKPAAEER